VLVGCCRLLVTVNCALDFRRHFKQEVPLRVSGPTRACAPGSTFLTFLVWLAYVCNRLTHPRARRRQKPCGRLPARAAALAGDRGSTASAVLPALRCPPAWPSSA